MTREEQLACLKDRPCDVCKMRTDKGCSSWECVFEQTPDEEKNICNRCQHQIVCKLEDGSAVAKCAEYLEIKRSDFEKCVPKPTTKENLVVEDAISRQQAIDKMQELEDEDNEMYGCSIPEGFDGKRATEALKALPSIQPKWISSDDFIKSLEAEYYEDCISRQAVLEAFNLSEKTRKYGGDHSGYDTMMLYEIQDVIEDLPCVKPKTDVLDKIRAEITTLQNRCYSLTKGTMCAFCKFECKYRAESEEV